MAERSHEERLILVENDLRGLSGRMDALEVRVTSLDERFQQFQVEVRAEFSATRAEIREGDEETRRLMRVLFEDLVHRISLINRG